jgi:hypothetical protein
MVWAVRLSTICVALGSPRARIACLAGNCLGGREPNRPSVCGRCRPHCGWLLLLGALPGYCLVAIVAAIVKGKPARQSSHNLGLK